MRNPPTYPVSLFYDRGCAVCRSEMDALRQRDLRQRLRFVDISAPDFDAAVWGATRAQLDVLMHAIDAQGRVWRGVPALSLAYATVGLGWLWAPTGWPLLRPLFDAGYAWFARHRQAISRTAAPLIEHIAAVRTARRMKQCARGQCER